MYNQSVNFAFNEAGGTWLFILLRAEFAVNLENWQMDVFAGSLDAADM